MLNSTREHTGTEEPEKRCEGRKTLIGAKPIVMDFGEVPTALQTGLIDGADYSSLATNYAGGHYEQNKYATYPGFHSMPADHLACNTKVWKKLKPHERGAMKAGIEIAGRTITSLVERKNAEAVKALNEMGIFYLFIYY